MLKKFRNLFAIIITFSLTFIHLSSLSNTFTLGKRVTLESEVLSEERELQVLLPENYQAHAQASYPVIYLIDGDYNFTGVAGMLDLLANKGQLIPDVILVGIADKGTKTYHKYTTPNGFSSPSDEKTTGQASKLLAFITDEVKPYIAKRYRASDHSTLVGQSMGGLFVLNSLIESPTSFTNYVAISPSVWLSDNGIVKKAKNKLIVTKEKPVNLFLSLADETHMGVYDFLNLLDFSQPENLDWSFKHYPDENHNSIGLIALRDSLKSIFHSWYLTDKELAKLGSAQDIVSYYKQLMDEQNFNQVLPSASTKAAVRYHYRQKQIEKLPKFIESASQKLPASKRAFIAMQASYAGHFDTPQAALALLKSVEVEFKHSIEHIKSIAATYEQLNDIETAHHYYQRALVVAMQQKAQQWQLNIINAKIEATDK